MKDILNERIKKREPFGRLRRRFEEQSGHEQTHPAPTMLMVYQIARTPRRDPSGYPR
jgi:hypothetical protein